MNASLALSLIGPIVSIFFGVSFFLASSYAPGERRYLRLLSLAFFAFGLAATSQILLVPANIGQNTMISAAIYTLGALAFSEGLLQRSGKSLGYSLHILLSSSIIGSIYFFYYVELSLIVRIYILNFGFGGLLLAVAIKLRKMRNGRSIDRLVWWTMLVFSLQFFPRTLMTVGSHAPTRGAFAHSQFWIVLQASMALFVVVFAFVLMIAALVDIIDALKLDRDHDVLTGLLNRRGFERQAKSLMRGNGDTSFNLIVCDIDHFKAINDGHGHTAGDMVLREFARLLQHSLRSIDVVGRIGGEEFVALLPDCDEEGMLFLVRRLREQVLRKRYQGLPESQVITASFGIAARISREGLWDWFARADIALYSAKTGGRNRVFLHDPIEGVIERTSDQRLENIKLPDRRAIRVSRGELGVF